MALTEYIKKIYGRPYYVVRLKDLDQLILNIEDWASGAGFETDSQAKVTSADTTASYLATKIVAGAGVTLATLNPGGNETLEISAGGGGGSGIYGGDGDVLVNTTINDTAATWGGTNAGNYVLKYNARNSGQIRVSGWMNDGTTPASLTGAFTVAVGANAKLSMGAFNGHGDITFGHGSGGNWASIRQSGTYFDSSLMVGHNAVATAMLEVRGSGATSATSSLLVQNSALDTHMQLNDDGSARFGKGTDGVIQIIPISGSGDGVRIAAANGNVMTHGFGISSGSVGDFHIYANNYTKFNWTGYGLAFTEAASVSVTPDTSALLDLQSVTKGFLQPRMTGAQVEAIGTPATGLLAYATNAGAGDVTGEGWWGYDGTNWVQGFSGGGASIYSADGTLTGARTVTQGTNSLTFTGAVAGFSDLVQVNSTNSSSEDSGPRITQTHVANSGSMWFQNGGGGGYHNHAWNFESEFGFVYRANNAVSLGTTSGAYFHWFADGTANNAMLYLNNYNGALGPGGEHNELKFSTNNGSAKSRISFGEAANWWYIEGGHGGTGKMNIGAYAAAGPTNTNVITIDSSLTHNVGINTDGTTIGAKLHIVGAGATSATRSLRIENSAGDNSLVVTDDLKTTIGETNNSGAVSTASLTVGAFSNGAIRFSIHPDSYGINMGAAGGGITYGSASPTQYFTIADNGIGLSILGSDTSEGVGNITALLSTHRSMHYKLGVSSTANGGGHTFYVKNTANNANIKIFTINNRATSGDSVPCSFENVTGLVVGANVSSLDASAILQTDSTTQGFLPPRVANTSAVTSPATGLMIYDNSTNQWMGYNGTSWVILG